LLLDARRTSLREVAVRLLSVELDKGEQKSDWGAAELSDVQKEYAALDAFITWRLANEVLPQLLVQRSAYEIQMTALPAVTRMISRGVLLSREAHAKLIADLRVEEQQLGEEYREACLQVERTDLAEAGIPHTPAQKIKLLRELLTADEIATWPRAEKGALSTKREDLLRALHYAPIPPVAKLSRTRKLIESFGTTLVNRISPSTGRIHAGYQLAMTDSGRASCREPNIQQMPKRREFRALIVAPSGKMLVGADFSTMEGRAAAMISGDRALNKIFSEGRDWHKATAAGMFNIPSGDVTDEQRNRAKAINFGSMYGMRGGGLVRSLFKATLRVISRADADHLLDLFDAAFPEFSAWRKEHYRECELLGRILIGRDARKGSGRIYKKSQVPPGKSFYTRCCNLPIQGACADASMLALAYVDERLLDVGIDGEDGVIVWAHDEILVQAPKVAPRKFRQSSSRR
jgi:DNA polymerase-1